MSKNSEPRPGAKVLDVLLSLILLAGVGYGGYYVAAQGHTIDQTTTYYDPEADAPTEPEEENFNNTSINYENVEIPNTEINNSPLILVNESFACSSYGTDMVSLSVKRSEAESNSFAVRDDALLVKEILADSLIRMFNDFQTTSGKDDLIVTTGYRSVEEQQELYDNDLANTGLDYSDTVAVPGYSEHQTGWCVDVDINGDEDYDGTGDYAWINEQCYKYGIIRRYPEDKEGITGLVEPWHYRYVGAPHATIIMNENMCLEEYIDFLKSYPYEGNHLQITDYDGKIYEIYYFPMDNAYETTLVPVPLGLDYTLCGNNIDGFIVTIDTGETDDSTVPADADPEQPENWEEIPVEEAPVEGEPPAEEIVQDMEPVVVPAEN